MHYISNEQFKTISIFRADKKVHRKRIEKLFNKWCCEYHGVGLRGMPLSDFIRGADEFFIAECDGKDVGILILNRDSYGKVIDIVYVEPEYRGRGFATAMFNHVIQKRGANTICLDLKSVDDAKATYWKNLGFKSVAIENDANNLHFDKCILTTLDYIPNMPICLELSSANIKAVKTISKRLAESKQHHLV
jgi:GNAT superfamily N-acetyltransferase